MLPLWEQGGAPVSTLFDLVENVRHAVAHGHVSFYDPTYRGSSRLASDVTITFENPKRPLWKGGPWKASINGKDLLVFDRMMCEWLIRVVDARALPS